MSCRVELSPRAIEQLRSLPTELLGAFQQNLQDLAAAPDKLGRPACFPHPPVGYIFPFHADLNGDRVWFTVFFAPDATPIEDATVLGVMDFTCMPRIGGTGSLLASDREFDSTTIRIPASTRASS